jgi:hypothetical protein
MNEPQESESESDDSETKALSQKKQEEKAAKKSAEILNLANDDQMVRKIRRPSNVKQRILTQVRALTRHLIPITSDHSQDCDCDQKKR